jgi:serine/threonine-protein kinase
VCQINYPDVVEFCPRDGNRLPPGPHDTQAMYDPLIGSTIDGRYIIEQVIGQGGMGFVYAARHAIIDKRVAIKVLKSEHARDQAAVERFLVEAKAASKIGHQNIVDITDFGVLPAQPGERDVKHAYFVMEFLDGPTLGKLVHEKGYIDPKQAIAITVQIARGLQAAHDKGIIHRDLKPENVFVLERDGQKDVVKIVDFGIARDVTHKKRLTQAGMVLGTPEYMSPEQATGQPTDHRVDMYALGCILYEMLTGDVPYKGETATKTLTMHVFEKPVPPSQKRPDLRIPASLEQVVMRTIEKKPQDRFADLRVMMNELDRVDAELRAGTARPALVPISSQVTGPSALVDADEVPRSHGRLGLLVAVAAVLVLSIVGMALAVSKKNKPEVAVVPDAPQASQPVAVAAPPAPALRPSGASETAAEIEIVLRSVPPGAEIFEGVERLGLAPVTIRRARGSKALTFTIRRAGYQEVKRDVTPDRDRDVEVLLAPKQNHVADSRHHGSKAPVAAPAPAPVAQPKPAAPPVSPKKQSDLRNPFE